MCLYLVFFHILNLEYNIRMNDKVTLPSNPIFIVSKYDSEEVNSKRVDWTSQLDEHLAKLANEHKAKYWKSIAIRMRENFLNPNITAKKCRERWACCVNPGISKLSLTDAESLLLVFNHETLQNNWSKMAKKIPRRYSSTLKNNFYSLIRSVLRKITCNELSKVTALFFLQTIYISWVSIRLLENPPPPHKQKGAVPIHIYKLVQEK